MRAPRGHRLQKGTLLDHLGHWQAPQLVELLGIAELDKPAALLIGQRSRQYRRKDVLMIQDWVPDELTALRLKLRAPQVTINIVEDYQVIEKYRPELPAELTSLVKCPNNRCITYSDQAPPRIKTGMGSLPFECYYCEYRFSRDEVEFV